MVFSIFFKIIVFSYKVKFYTSFLNTDDQVVKLYIYFFIAFYFLIKELVFIIKNNDF